MAKTLTLRSELGGIATLLGAIWLIFVISYVVPLNSFGLIPRSFDGLIGIVSMPFLHANISHIVSNTVPLAVLLALLIVSRNNPWYIVFVLIVVSGLSLWIIGRTAIHIGASGLIYALMGFLIAAGLVEKRFKSLIIATIVGVVYGSVLISGILPGVPGVSWDGHLCGLVAGALVAWIPGGRPR